MSWWEAADSLKEIEEIEDAFRSLLELPEPFFDGPQYEAMLADLESDDPLRDF